MCLILLHGIPRALHNDPRGEYNYPHIDEQMGAEILSNLHKAGLKPEISMLLIISSPTEILLEALRKHFQTKRVTNLNAASK